MHRLWFLALAVAVFAEAAALASPPEVFLLIHPKSALDKGDAEKLLTPTRKGRRAKAHYRVSSALPQVVVGAVVKDVSHAGPCFIVELPPSKVRTVTRTVLGIPKGETMQRRVPYTDVYVDQPYNIWYCKDANAEPELIGKATVCGSASSWVGMGAERGAILPDKPAELARKASVEMHKDLGNNMSDAFIEKVVVGKPSVMTAQEFWRHRGGRSFLPPPVFKPSKIVSNAKGETVIEIELHNRLPAKVSCSLSRKMPVPEAAALRRIPGAQNQSIPVKLLHVDLEPGEKKTAQFVVPPLPNGAQLAAGSTITATAVLRYPKK